MNGMRTSFWMRSLVVLVMVTLFPFAPPGGFGGAGIAGAAPDYIAVTEKGHIAVYYDDSSGDYVEIQWEVFYENDYDPEVLLYRKSGGVEELLETGQDYSLTRFEDEYENQWQLKSIGHMAPGQYRLVVRVIDLQDPDEPADVLEYEFEVPERQPVTVYVFGADEEIGDLELVDEREDRAAPVPGSVRRISEEANGFAYVFEAFPDRCFTLKSDTYHFSIVSTWSALCPDDGNAFVVHASETPYLLQLDQYYFWEEDDGILRGYIWLIKSGGFGVGANIYGKEDEEGNGCSYQFYENEMLDVTCQLPYDPSHVEIFAEDSDGKHPTNLIFRLDDVELDITVKDLDGRFGFVEQEIEFNVSGEAGIALYQFVPGFTSDIRYVTGDEIGTHTVGPWETQQLFRFYDFNYPDHFIALHMVDNDGRLFAMPVALSVVDSMTDETGILDYAELNPLSGDFTHGNPVFKDDDKSAGGRAGTIEWQVPEYGTYEKLAAYDLYYADGNNGILGGAERVYNPIVISGKFTHKLLNIPANAEKLAVVPILYSFGYYKYAPTFHLTLEDRVAARLDQLFVNGDEVLPNPDDATSYEVTVPWNEDEVKIKVYAEGGVVYFDDHDVPSDGEITIPLSDAPIVVKIRVHTPNTEWTEEYNLTIKREPDPDAPKLTSLIVFGVNLKVDDTNHAMIVPRETVSVPVIATADSGVRITLNGNEHYGMAAEDIPVTEDDFVITITLDDPDTTLTTEYKVRIRLATAAVLANDVRFGQLVAVGDGFEYRYVTKGLTAGELKALFVIDSDIAIDIRSSDLQLVPDGEEVPPGATVNLSRGAEFQIIRLRWLSDYLRNELGIGESESITLGHIALFVVGYGIDVTGDGKFDQQDVRLLLREIR